MRSLVIGTIVVLLETALAWAGDCTTSKRFTMKHAQTLSGVVADPTGAYLTSGTMDLLAGKRVVATVVFKGNGLYDFGTVSAGKYRIHIRVQGDYFCAPNVICDSAACKLEKMLRLNPSVACLTCTK